MFRRPHGRLKHHGPKPTKFGESLSADHLVSHSEKSQSLLGDKNAVVVYDRYSNWKGVYPVPSKSGNDAFTALQHFVGARTKVGEIYTDNSPELANAIKHLGWCHARNTPGISQTNSTIELQVQDILHGSRTLLVQAGLPACFWNYSAPHYCFGTNITQHGDRKSAYELRFPQEGKFQHEFYPFGCLVHFMQTKTLKDDDRPAKFAPTGATGILLGYKLHPGGKWRHEYIVADVREFDAVDFHATSDPKKRRKVREQIVQEIRLPEGEVTFPLVANYKSANGTVPLQPPIDDGMPTGSSNFEPLLVGNPDADEEQENPDHVVTIADIFKGPDFGDEVSDGGSYHDARHPWCANRPHRRARFKGQTARPGCRPH